MCRRVRLTAKLGLGALGIELFVRDKVAIRILYHKPASTLPPDARPLRYENLDERFRDLSTVRWSVGRCPFIPCDHCWAARVVALRKRQPVSLANNRVSACQQRLRDREPKCTRRLEIDRKFVLCRLLYRKITRFGTFEDLVDEDCRL